MPELPHAVNRPALHLSLSLMVRPALQMMLLLLRMSSRVHPDHDQLGPRTCRSQLRPTRTSSPYEFWARAIETDYRGDSRRRRGRKLMRTFARSAGRRAAGRNRVLSVDRTAGSDTLPHLSGPDGAEGQRGRERGPVPCSRAPHAREGFGAWS